MNEIKKVMEQIPVPKTLHQAAENSLKQKLTKRVKYWMLPSVAAIFILLFTSSFVFSDYISIPDFFSEKEQKLMELDDSVMLKSELFTISLKDFVDKKENLRMIHELNKIPFTLTNEEILNQMIEQKLLIYEAKKDGIVATEDEVLAYADQTKEAWQYNDNADLQEIAEQLAKKLNVSVDQYFYHPNTLKQYEEVVLVNNYVGALYGNGTLNDGFTIENLQIQLLEKYSEELMINEELLRQID